MTLWLRLRCHRLGLVADRVGRKTPLMISILWYWICNFIAGFSPSFWSLFLFRAMLGIGMGAEWPAGAALAMETWPVRSRGLMSGICKGRGRWASCSPPVYARVQCHWLARNAVARRLARARCALDSEQRQGAGSLGGEQKTAADRNARSGCR